MSDWLIGTNLLTLIFLGMALRSNWLWRQAYRSLDRRKAHRFAPPPTEPYQPHGHTG